MYLMYGQGQARPCEIWKSGAAGVHGHTHNSITNTTPMLHLGLLVSGSTAGTLPAACRSVVRGRGLHR